LSETLRSNCAVQPRSRRPRVFEPLSYQAFLEAPAQYVERLPLERVSDIRTRHTYVLHAPKGDLKWVYEEDAGIFSPWDMHRPVESVADVETLLSVPYKFTPPAPAPFEAFRRHRAEMKENAIGAAAA